MICVINWVLSSADCTDSTGWIGPSNWLEGDCPAAYFSFETLDGIELQPTDGTPATIALGKVGICVH